MRPNRALAILLASLLLVTAAVAGPKGNNDNGKGHDNGNGNSQSEG